MLAHRDELIQQTVEKILTINPAADVGVVKADRNELHRDVVVASIQTLPGDRDLPRSSRTFSTIIVDEAHHAAADTYRRTLEHLGCFARGRTAHGRLYGHATASR